MGTSGVGNFENDDALVIHKTNADTIHDHFYHLNNLLDTSNPTKL